jgi:hypothetical protein
VRVRLVAGHTLPSPDDLGYVSTSTSSTPAGSPAGCLAWDGTKAGRKLKPGIPRASLIIYRIAPGMPYASLVVPL